MKFTINLDVLDGGISFKLHLHLLHNQMEVEDHIVNFLNNYFQDCRLPCNITRYHTVVNSTALEMVRST